MDADSSNRPAGVIPDDGPASTTRLTTIEIDVDIDSDDQAPTQRAIAADPEDEASACPTLQSPLPVFFRDAERGHEGPASLYPIEFAAPRLHRSTHKLRGMIRSTARRAGLDLRVTSIVDLGGGVVAHKIGGHWFLRLPRR